MSDLVAITASDEITRILKAAQTAAGEVYCELAEEGSKAINVELEIRGVIGTNVVLGLKKKEGAPAQLLSSVFPKGLKIGSPVEVVFSLVDGQYAIRDIIQDTSMATFTVSAGRHLLRLQRRKDFRVSVRMDDLRFELLDEKSGAGPASGVVALSGAKSGAVASASAKPGPTFQILDLSAGGLRLLWPPSSGPFPALGSTVQGRLHLGVDGEKKTIDVEMKMVKDHGLDSPLKPDAGQALSFQFQGLGQAEARTVLFTCLFIHRKNYGER